MCIGSSAATDRKQQLNAYGDLNNSINKLNSLGNSLNTAGSAATGQATKYYSDILSGDPNRVAAAMAPAAGQAQERNSQLLKQIANFGNRGGGTNQTTQNLGENTRTGLIDATTKAQGGAAENLASIGGQETGQGLSADTAAANTAANLFSGATTARSQSAQLHADAVRNWANLVTSVLQGNGAGPALGGWQPS